MLREALWQATDGKLDIFTGPKIRKIATFGPRMEIENAAWPAIADCHFGMKVNKNIFPRRLETNRAGYSDFHHGR